MDNCVFARAGMVNTGLQTFKNVRVAYMEEKLAFQYRKEH